MCSGSKGENVSKRAKQRRGSAPAKLSKGSKSKRPLFVRILLWTVTALAALFLIAVLAFVLLYLLIDIPKANDQATQQVSVVYYSDGKTEMGRFTTTNREPVELKRVPLATQRAFLAAEDRSFYSNRGVSPTGIARAFINNFSGSGSSSQGGSTITQQYVKNYFLTQDQTVSRKVKEIVISLKIDQEYSKDRILQDYLNNVYFGRGAYGIQAASKSYFHKDVSQLTPVEGSFLASVLNNPENMDPTVGPNSAKRANQRMAYVLNGMVSAGWMSKAEREKAVMPTFYKRQPVKYASGPEGYIIQSVRRELSRKLKLSQNDIDRGGLRITTTIDKKYQDAAVAAVHKHIPQPYVGKLRTGLVAQKPNDGAIVAMYGGRDYDPVKSPYSDADQAMLQQASTMKTFTAIAALQSGKTMDNIYNGNSPMRNGKGSFVSNDGGESWGYQPIYQMLAHSINTGFVRLNGEIGPMKTLKVAEKSGFPSTLGGMKYDNSINTLGTGDARVVDMTTAYNTLNSGGQFYDRYLINKITTFDGSYSYDVKKDPKEAYAKGIADDVTWALSKTGIYGSAAGTQYQLGRPMAGKTGTASGNKYIWFAGFTPGQLTTSVGMYYSPDGKSVKSMQNLPGLSIKDIYGAGLPTQIWTDFMRTALQGQDVAKIPQRSYYNETERKPTPKPTPSASTPKAPKAPGSVSGSDLPSQGPRTVEPDVTDQPTDQPTGPSTDQGQQPGAGIPPSPSAPVNGTTTVQPGGDVPSPGGQPSVPGGQASVPQSPVPTAVPSSP